MNSSSHRAALEQITAAEVAQLAQTLVAIPTHLPHGTAAAVRWLRRMVSTERLHATIQSTEKGGHDNLLIGYPTLSTTPKLLLNGHLDTVPPPPHGGRPVADGKLLFGRGAADMKGGLAAMIMAMVPLLRSGVSPKRPVLLAALAGEETGGIGTATLLRKIHPDTSLIGEPTQLRLVTAHKGVQWFQITVEGRAAHASRPVEGRNSIVAAAAIIQSLDQLAHKLRQTRTHPLLGPPTLNIGVIRGGVTPNVVPSLCTIQVDRRWLPSEDPELIREELETVVESAVGCTEDLKIRIEPLPETAHCRPMETLPDHPFVHQLQQAAAEEKLPVEVRGVPYGTDGSLLATQGIPTVISAQGIPARLIRIMNTSISTKYGKPHPCTFGSYFACAEVTHPRDPFSDSRRDETRRLISSNPGGTATPVRSSPRGVNEWVPYPGNSHQACSRSVRANRKSGLHVDGAGPPAAKGPPTVGPSSTRPGALSAQSRDD